MTFSHFSLATPWRPAVKCNPILWFSLSTSLSLKSPVTPWSCHVVEHPQECFLRPACPQHHLFPWEKKQSRKEAERRRKEADLFLSPFFVFSANPVWAGWASLVILVCISKPLYGVMPSRCDEGHLLIKSIRISLFLAVDVNSWHVYNLRLIKSLMKF